MTHARISFAWTSICADRVVKPAGDWLNKYMNLITFTFLALAAHATLPGPDASLQPKLKDLVDCFDGFGIPSDHLKPPKDLAAQVRLKQMGGKVFLTGYDVDVLAPKTFTVRREDGKGVHIFSETRAYTCDFPEKPTRTAPASNGTVRCFDLQLKYGAQSGAATFRADQPTSAKGRLIGGRLLGLGPSITPECPREGATFAFTPVTCKESLGTSDSGLMNQIKVFVENFKTPNPDKLNDPENAKFWNGYIEHYQKSFARCQDSIKEYSVLFRARLAELDRLKPPAGAKPHENTGPVFTGK